MNSADQQIYYYGRLKILQQRVWELEGALKDLIEEKKGILGEGNLEKYKKILNDAFIEHRLDMGDISATIKTNVG